MNTKADSISIVVPVHNEEGNLEQLTKEIIATKESFQLKIEEVLFVDDGSTDDTYSEICRIATETEGIPVRAIRFRRRQGKSVALLAGFQLVKGDLIATLDGDLQDDPAELKALLEKIDEGYDVVCGWKVDRQDPLEKRVSSKVFNFVVRQTSGLSIHDHNCGLKLYRRRSLRGLKVYGDLHRFLPVLLAHQGFSVAEVPVKHRARGTGKTKYGLKRIFTGALDFITVIAITKFSDRPGHFFGGIGLALFSTGFLILSYLSVLWCLSLGPIGTRPLFFLGILCLLLGTQFILFGVLAEIVVRRFFRYRVNERAAEAINLDRDLPWG